MTERVIRTNHITRAAWIDDGVAATLLAERRLGKTVYYRVMGLAVAPAHRRRGHAAALMRRIETLVPTGAEIEVGVDLGRPSTDWLMAWYTTRLGYALRSESDEEAVLRKRV
jgi:GNAT superfamily N-acetyltransferase